MRLILTKLIVFLLISGPVWADQPPMEYQMNAHSFSFVSIDGEPMPLADYKGQTLLIVNTASQCGFTDQYAGLQKLYDSYKDQGLVVIGVPCNNFGNQEPGDSATIKEFVREQYGITFPLAQKVNVRGKDAHPFYLWAAEQNVGGFLSKTPKWNFHKYVVNGEGVLVGSFGSMTDPADEHLVAVIQESLAGG